MLRGALVELKSLLRIPGPWLPLALGVWILVVWLQEPPFLRRSGVPFYWHSIGAALDVSLAMVPLAWLLARSPKAAEACLRAARSPFRMISINAFAIIVYGILTATAGGLFGWLLEAARGPRSPVPALQTVLSGLGLLAPLACLAPGLANLTLSAHGYTMSWLLIAVLCTSLTGPGVGSFGQVLVPAALASAAGLLLSTAVVTRRIHI